MLRNQPKVVESHEPPNDAATATLGMGICGTQQSSKDGRTETLLGLSSRAGLFNKRSRTEAAQEGGEEGGPGVSVASRKAEPAGVLSM